AWLEDGRQPVVDGGQQLVGRRGDDREGRRKARPGNRRRVEPREREQSPALEPRVEGLLALLPGHGLPLVEAVRRDETAAPLDRVLKQAAFGHGLDRKSTRLNSSHDQ